MSYSNQNDQRGRALRIYIARALGNLELDFYDIFLPNIGKGQKEAYRLSTEPFALCLIANPALVFALRS